MTVAARTEVTGANALRGRENGVSRPLGELEDEFLDLAGTGLGEASFGPDDAKATLLEDAP
jgi:hypothetical protein